MKKVVVLSDTHGNVTDLIKIQAIMAEADLIFHLGDGYTDINKLGAEILKKTVRVGGNCDAFGEKEIVTEIEGVKVLLTHGDIYGVKTSLKRLIDRAKESGANAVFYGHTHRSFLETIDGITVCNPGNVYKYSVNKSFAYAVFHNGKITVAINENAFI